MISIIVCSKHNNLNQELKRNIYETIGIIPFEIIWIDNSNNKYNIFQAYQEGVRLAKYDFLCFMHEDIVFHSQDWGIAAVAQMENDYKIGMLGVIGSIFISEYSKSWAEFPSNHHRGRIIQGYNASFKRKYKTFSRDYSDCSDNEVVAIDGCWMFMRRSLFEGKIEWDSTTFSGFHFYDLDMSMQVIVAGYRIEVVPIWIEHKSMGTYNIDYWDDYLVFHKKWNNSLPIGISAFLPGEDIKYHFAEIIAGDKKRLLEQERILKKIGYYKLFTIKRVVKQLLGLQDSD